MRKGLGISIIVVLLVSIGMLVLVLVACASGQDVKNPPSVNLLEKGNPKLDSQLNQLVHAERNGEAASFAEQSSIELVDGNVRVIVECLPDQVDAAVEAASALGVVETSYRNLLQVVVPITSLTTLADATSTRFIRLPQYPSPAAKGEVDDKPN
jgi:hypothetical protein